MDRIREVLQIKTANRKLNKARKRKAIVFASTLALLVGVTSGSLGIAAPPPGEIEFNVGLNWYKKKNYGAAEPCFRDSIKLGNKSASVWLYSGHTLMALGRNEEAKQAYEVVVRSFKSSPEAAIAAQGLKRLSLMPAGTTSSAHKPAASSSSAPRAGAAPAAVPAADPIAAKGGGLMDRIFIHPPLFGHPPVSQKTIAAVKAGVADLPPKMRKDLDASGASIHLSPNMIDRWPNDVNNLPEDDDAPTLAELPGRLYGKEMNAYERVKIRNTTALKPIPRTPTEMRHTAMNCCFQVLDDLQEISKSPELRAAYNADKASISNPLTQEKLRTFLKDDDWGARETCAELTASMLGGGNEFTQDLYRNFPRTKAWLKAKFGI